MSEFCHLHCHSEYSLLDGMSRLEDMVLRAKELNQPAIALTDHGVMFGAIEFYRAAKKHGIKPIMGVEAYLAARGMTDREPKLDRRSFHMLLLAQNQTGYQNLLKLSSDAQLKGFYQKPRIDRELLANHAAGVIASTGCLAGEVPRTIINEGEKAAYEKLKWYLDVFGRDRFFLELQGHDIPELRTVNNVLLNWSRKHEVGLIATNDVHYVGKDDAAPHEVLLCMQTHDVLTNPKRMKLTPHGSYYITSTQEMASKFGDYPDALKNTIRIAEMCEVDLDPKGYHLPIFPVPEGYDAQSYLVYLVEKGLVERYGEYRAKHDPVVRERIERELGIINNMGFDTYFLIVWDLCLFAAREDIWWNVRGSGAGSVVAYTLRITNIDPIKNDLIFERFLNPHRVSMPDFDLDFPDDRRYRMIEYAVQKYGEEKCAAIITFGTLGARAAVRDVGRTLGMETTEINRLAQMMPSTGKVKLKKVLFGEKGLEEWPIEAASIREIYQKDSQIKKVLDTAMKLEGQTRHASTHAAGILISDKPIVEYAPLHRSTKGNDSGPIQQVVQFDMNIVESIGLLKVDFLGLATLSVMRRACEHVAQRHGRELNLNTIPYERNPDDPEFDANLMKAYELLQRGETVGVFQVESDGLRRVLQDMLPDQFEHIIAAISLYRPGPLEYIPSYIERMHGREDVAYHHDLQKPILENTYGICVSGDAIVIDAQTGQRYRLDEVGALPDFMIQGVDERWQPAVGHVTHWIDSGHKPVYEVTLRNGASIKVTEDHRLLTEEGWQPLKDIKVGGYIGTPPYLIGVEGLKNKGDRAALSQTGVVIPSRTSSKGEGARSNDFSRSAPQETTEVVTTSLSSPCNLPDMMTDMPQTSRSLNVVWQEVLSIEPAGTSHVYDLTVEGLHSFVANQIIVHNCVYQEQIMRMATDIAGYSPGEADLMRRAVSKKKEKEIERHKKIFIEGAGKNGVDRKSATKIYEDIEFFARYGFNKSHAADYAVITVQTAYLKAHYPVEYLCALLEVEFDDTAKVPVLINECRRLGIDVLQPDINASGARFTIEENTKNKQLAKDDYRRWAIRVGLGAIKSVGLTGVESLILAEREAKGTFKTLDDFAERVNLRLLKRSVVKNLATVGSFDELVRPIVPDTPREVVAHKDVIDRMMGISSSVHAAASIGQLSMFGMMAASTPKISRTSVLKPLPDIGKVDPKQRLDNEKELLGIYISEHPLQQVASQVGKNISHFCSDITEDLVEQRVNIAGLLVGTPRVITTKKGKPMAFIKLEDLKGQIEVVVFPRTYEQAKDILAEDEIFLVQGKVNLRNDSLSVLADKIKLYQPGESDLNGSEPNANGAGGASAQTNTNGSTGEDSSPLQCHITLTMQRTDDYQEDLTRLERVMLALQEHQGKDKLSLRCVIPNGNIVQMDFPKLTVSWNAALKDIIDSQNMLLDFKDITPSKKRKYRKKA